MTRRALWLDPGLGVSGDMMLGALIGAGANIESVRAGLSALKIDGWSINESEAIRCGLSATRIEVQTSDSDHHRPWSTIDSLLAESELPLSVGDGARRTFRLLGEIEAAQHGVELDEVHFHEVGAIDAIIDIVGSWLALDDLGVTEVHCGPVGLGHGTVQSAHGLLPLPAPATLALLSGIPVSGLDFVGETTTPTGAALVATMTSVFGPIPTGTVLQTARGAGHRDPKHYPNVTSAVLVELAPVQPGGTPALELVTNLDDVTAEVLGYVIAKLIEAGADDAWVVPIQMKKNRPGHQLRVLTSPDMAPELREMISAETGTLGIRQFPATKFALERSFHTIELYGCEVRLKLGPWGAKPEHDDLVLVATKTGLPLRQLAIEALMGQNLTHESSRP